jgi:hypothetical protein
VNLRRPTLALAIVLLLASATGASSAATLGCNGLLAFARFAPDANWDFYSISLHGRRTDLSRTAGSDNSPRPSPDGSKLAFWTEAQLIVSNIDGSDPRLIPWAATMPLPAIAYDSGVTPGEVFVQRLDGTKVKPIAPGTLTSWSPDGSHLLIANPSGQAQIVPAAGGEPVAIPDLAGPQVEHAHDRRRRLHSPGASTQPRPTKSSRRWSSAPWWEGQREPMRRYEGPAPKRPTSDPCSRQRPRRALADANRGNLAGPEINPGAE